MLASKIPPLGSMLKFDADVKNSTARHQCENRQWENLFFVGTVVVVVGGVGPPGP